MEDFRSEPANHSDAPKPRGSSALRKFLLGAAVVTVLFCGLAWWMSGPSEPVYQGHGLSWWLYYMVRADDRQELSREDFQTIGPRGVQWLIWTAEHGRRPQTDEEEYRSPATKYDLWRKIFRRGLPAVHDEREAALVVLKKLGPDAAPAIPMLQRVLLDPKEEYGNLAGHALVAIGPAALRTIDESYPAAPEQSRYALVVQIDNYLRLQDGVLAGEFNWCVRFLTKACADADSDIRSWAATTLVERSAAADENEKIIQPILSGLLPGAEPDVCVIALEAFPSSSPEVMAAIPRLGQYLNHTNAKVRSGAAKILTGMLADPDPNVQKLAKEAIRRKETTSEQ